MERSAWSIGLQEDDNEHDHEGLSLIAIVVPLCAGCESYRWPLYANPSVTPRNKENSASRIPLGLGRKIDLSGNEAMRQERGASTIALCVPWLGGKECVVAHGE